jgi:hypothetical protein
MSLDTESRSWLAPVSVLKGALTIAAEPIPIRDMNQSAASLLAFGSVNIALLDVDPMRWGITDAGRITLRRTASFDLVATSEVRTALGLSGTYTGAADYTAVDVAPGVVIPTRGLRLDGPLWSSEGYRPANTSGAATGALHTLGGGSVLLDLPWADAWALETTARGVVYDIVHCGRWVGRGRVTDVTRERQGRLSSIITLSLSVQGTL